DDRRGGSKSRELGDLGSSSMFSQRSQSRTVVSSIFEQRILSCDALAIQSGNLGFGNPVEFLSCRADGLPAGARPASSAGFRGVEAQAARPLAAADCFAPAEPEVGGAVDPARELVGARDARALARDLVLAQRDPGVSHHRLKQAAAR